MHPTDLTFSDLYASQRHQQTSQYYSHFPAQNPNPYPLHQQHHLRTEPHFTSAVTDPDPPGVDAYLRSYSLSHAGGAYNAHHAGGLTYSHAIGAAPPPAYVSELVTQNWRKRSLFSNMETPYMQLVQPYIKMFHNSFYQQSLLTRGPIQIQLSSLTGTGKRS